LFGGLTDGVTGDQRDASPVETQSDDLNGFLDTDVASRLVRPARMNARPQDEASAEAQRLLRTALGSQPGIGMTESTLRRLTGLGFSLFQEALHLLVTTGQVAVSHPGGRQTQAEYHLVSQETHTRPQEGPISLLAVRVLERLQTRAEGARSMGKALEIDLSLIQVALDELEAPTLISRSQGAMLVIYRAVR